MRAAGRPLLFSAPERAAPPALSLVVGEPEAQALQFREPLPCPAPVTGAPRGVKDPRSRRSCSQSAGHLLRGTQRWRQHPTLSHQDSSHGGDPQEQPCPWRGGAGVGGLMTAKPGMASRGSQQGDGERDSAPRRPL